ncbi:flagellar biosynthetic protein FliR [Hyphomonas pacifica]|uniref:Flagellar biosynthetic protein FliR n=2 Tax=Hyphomonas pacifica TaxID=1280941 RepID=A0A062U6G1_9PROT|nr:flagellar biosynthetic protein FliR [Hyphomonas pacifica]KCZ52179.1 hypothetical protein HY2_09185 [Hyphomonas pacifica]RAN35033.1 hypothetical protein HY3_09315 [Hyphomonas pacifica]
MMPDGLPLGATLTAWITLYMLVVARLSFIVFLMPGIGEQTVPVRVRLALLLSLATAFATSGLVSVPSGISLGGYVGMLGAESIIGFGLGVLLRLSIWILSTAGAFIAQSIGLSQMLGVALETEAQTIVSNMLAMAGAALLLSADYHVNVFVRLAEIYSEIPVGAVQLFDRAFIIEGIFDSIKFAILIAWPFVAINLLYNISLGFINKALPSLMVAFVGAPFMIGAGFVLLAISISTMLVVWMNRASEFVDW